MAAGFRSYVGYVGGFSASSAPAVQAGMRSYYGWWMGGLGTASGGGAVGPLPRYIYELFGPGAEVYVLSGPQTTPYELQGAGGNPIELE